MDPQVRRALKRIKGRGRRRQRQQTLRAALSQIERTLARVELAIEERGTPKQWQTAYDDTLATYGLAGQLAEVAHSQREQIQALVDAYTRLSLSLEIHHGTSNSDRANIKELMSAMHLLLVPLVVQTRTIIRHLHDIGRAVGADPVESELRRIQDVETRDARPEEQRDG